MTIYLNENIVSYQPVLISEAGLFTPGYLYRILTSLTNSITINATTGVITFNGTPPATYTFTVFVTKNDGLYDYNIRTIIYSFYDMTIDNSFIQTVINKESIVSGMIENYASSNTPLPTIYANLLFTL